MRVDIWSDVVCPWCYLGKRRFEHALTEFSNRDQVRVVHRSFQLDPTMPVGRTFKQADVLASKYGLTQAQVADMQTRMEATAAAEGLEYHLTGGLTGNTLDAHRLLHLAKDLGAQDALLDRFYRAHFTEGRSLFDRESLVALAREAGLDAAEVRRVLAGNAYTDQVEADIRQARELGVSGVPFFVIDDRYGVSGAQPPEVFVRVMEQAWAEEHPASPVS